MSGPSHLFFKEMISLHKTLNFHASFGSISMPISFGKLIKLHLSEPRTTGLPKTEPFMNNFRLSYKGLIVQDWNSDYEQIENFSLQY